MISKEHLFMLIIFVSLLTLSAASAAEYDADDSISINDNELNLEETINEELILEDNNNEELILEDNDKEELDLDESNEAVLSEWEQVKSFTDLNTAINGNEDEEIYLNISYSFNPESDSNFASGININRNLTIHGNGFTLDGDNQARIFNITAENVVIKNITFINGRKSDKGGALYIENCVNTVIDNCTFINNYARMGGAIYSNNANISLSNCKIDNNKAMYAILFLENGDLCTLNHCNFTKNNATNGYGCIYFHELQGSVNNSYFENNTGVQGGGIYFYDEGIAENCVFANNRLEGSGYKEGAAIYFDNKYGKVNNCNFTNNSGGNALYSNNATIVNNSNFNNHKDGSIQISSYDDYGIVENSNFTDNENDKSYAGVYINGKGMVNNCNFINNTSPSTGGAVFIVREGIVNNSNFISNSVLNEYSSQGGAINFNGKGTVDNCNFINNTACKFGGAISFSSVGMVNNSNFTNYKVNGTMNVPRGGAIFFLSSVAIIENSNFDSNQGPWGGAVSFFNNGTINNCSFTNNKAQLGGAVYGEYNADIGAIITSCTFDNNSAEDGGALYYKVQNGYSGGNIRIADSNFTNNNASNSGAAYLKCENGTVANCIFENNSATESGGALKWENQKDGMVSNCNFIGNSAKNGGALYEANATECTFSNNTAEETCGAVYGGNIINCVFELNFAGIAGTENYDESITTATDCTSVIIRIIASDFETTYGFNEELPLTITDEEGKNYDGLNVTIGLYKDDELIDTYEGLSGEGWLVDLDGGVYKAALSVKNTNIEPVNITLTVNPLKTVIDAPEITTDYLTNKYLVVTLKDSQGKALIGSQITIDFNGLKNYTTDSNGQVKISTEGFASNTYPIKISYAGDDNHMGSNASTYVIINKISSQITANAVTTTYNINKNLMITLKDIKGNALSGVQVSVKIGSSTKTYKTDKNGQVKVNVATLVPKTYTALISFAGNTNYKASSKSVKVVVNKAKAKLTAKKKTFKRKVKVKKYAATLKTNNGKAMKKVQMTLKVKGKTFKAKTNNKGKAIFKIKNLKKAGTFKAVIKFKGNKYYKKLSKKVKVRVKK